MTLYGTLLNASPEAADAFLITSPVNRRYLTHFASSAGLAAVTPKTNAYFTDFRYTGAARKAKDEGVFAADIDIFEQKGDDWTKLFDGCETVLVEESFVTMSALAGLRKKLPNAKIVGGASQALEKLRAVKTDDELADIEKAQSITDAAFTHITDWLSDHLGKGIRECDVALELEYFMRLHGADGLAFDTIAVSGTKSAMPHGAPDETPVGEGFLTMDFGARCHGYCSDMTRTVCVGKPTEKMRDVYDTVLKAQEAALDFISAGKSGHAIDKVARDLIAARGYAGTFGHSLGHSLGLDIHERPVFAPSFGELIPAGAVVSVEPGVYLPGEFGVRIEDIVNITENGCKNLTKSPKELLIL